MKTFASSLLLIALITVLAGCAVSSPIWSQAHANGQNKVFIATIEGKPQKCVWVAVVSHPEHKARHLAHQKGLQILGADAHDVSVKVAYRDDGQCRIDMLMTTP